MAKIRFGYLDDFTAKNSSVGINTTEPQDNLEVFDGITKGKDLRVTGVSSFTGYEGFLRSDHQIEEETFLDYGQGLNSSLSGEIIVGTGQTVTINEIVKDTEAVADNNSTLWLNLVDGGHSGIIDRSPSDKGAFWNGSSFDLDGSNDVITGESCLTLFTDDTDHTIEMWVKFDDVTTRSTIISGYKSGDADRWDLEVNGGKIKGGHHDAGYFTSTASVITGKWYHLVFVNDHASSLWRVFINTATDVTNTNSGRDLTSDIVLGIGDRVDSSIGHLNGQISIVRIYSKELSSTEISTNYDLGPFAQETTVTGNLIVHYNASNPSSYPGTLNDADTSNFTAAGGSQIECMKVVNTFTPPSGGINDRPYSPKPGELFYNYDLKTIEFFNGYEWRQVDYTTRSGRGVFTGGNPNGQQRYETINLHSLGNSQYFGDFVHGGRYIHGTCGSSTRGIVGGGYDGGEGDNSQSDIEYFSITAGGKGIDFGDLDAQHFRNCSACSSSTRGIFVGGGHPSYYNTMEYITISTLGNAADFGDQTTQAAVKTSFSSPTRGFSFGGFPAYNPTVDVFTISSLGDATRFSELDSKHHSSGGCSNSVRGLFAGGYDGSANFYENISYITMSSEGHGMDFGDLTMGRNYTAGMATQTRAVFGGGLIATPNTNTNRIDYVNIASTGDAMDFGDIIQETQRQRATTDSHGGLGGY